MKIKLVDSRPCRSEHCFSLPVSDEMAVASVAVRTAATNAAGPNPIKKAATLLLCRPRIPSSNANVNASADGAEDFEILMVQRAAKSRFMASSFVFPGGVLEDADALFPPDLCAQEELAWRLESDDRAHRVAAVRETFEEAAVLLASGLTPSLLPSLEWRERVTKTPSELSTLCRECNARLRIAELRPFAHWLTPPQEKWRYDTRFYLAVLPMSDAKAASAAQADAREVRSAAWITPSAALAAFAEARMALPPPTWHTLRTLSEARTVSALERRYARVPSNFPQRWCPSIQSVDGSICVILPGDALHVDEGSETKTKPAPSDRHRIILKTATEYELQRTSADLS